jgi:hypothetical protein
VGCAEVIAFDQVRARQHWTTLRQRLHEHFDRWLDQLASALPESEPTLGQVSETIWAWLNMRFGELREQEFEQGTQQRFPSSSHVVHKLKEPQIQG